MANLRSEFTPLISEFIADIVAMSVNRSMTDEKFIGNFACGFCSEISFAIRISVTVKEFSEGFVWIKSFPALC